MEAPSPPSEEVPVTVSTPEIPLKERATIVGGRAKTFFRSEWPLGLALIGVPATVLLAGLFAPTPRDQYVYAGTFLQLVGIGVVAYGIRETRKMFKRPSLLARFLEIFRAPQGHKISMKVDVSAGADFAPSVRLGLSSEATVEQRLEYLERFMLRLDDAVRAEAKARGKAIAEVRESTERRHQQLAKADADLRDLIERSATGGLNMEAAGVICLVFGLVFASLPELFVAISSEFAALLSR